MHMVSVTRININEDVNFTKNILQLYAAKCKYSSPCTLNNYQHKYYKECHRDIMYIYVLNYSNNLEKIQKILEMNWEFTTTT